MTRTDELAGHPDPAAQNHAELAQRCPHLAEYNPFEPSHLADPYPIWSLAQREAPVFYIPAVGFWAVTGTAEILEAARDTATYTSVHLLDTHPVPAELEERLPKGWPGSYPSLLNADPPVHTPIRKLAQSAITPREVAKREPEIRELATSLADEFIADGSCDLMRQFTVPLPVRVIARVLGIPDEDTGDFRQWAEDGFKLSNPTLTHEELLDIGGRQADFKDYLEERIAIRQENPTDDLISRLVHAEVDGEPRMNNQQLVSAISQLLVGGNETTTNLIGNCVLILRTRFPEIWDRLCADPSIAPAVVEETLRIKSSIRGLFRDTTRETVLGGVTIPKGAKLWLVYAAANHDETIFEDPDNFDPERSNLKEHLAFGKWTHFCIGAPLARLESRVAMEELATRLPDLRITDTDSIGWLPSPFSQGLTTLPVAWD